MGYDKFLALFRLGYELGWNDHFDMLKDKEDGIIGKACDWLKRNGSYYIGFEQGQPCVTEELIKSLKKYLEKHV